MKRWVDNKYVVCKHMELYPAMEKNEVMKCADKWMKPEKCISSEATKA